MAANVLKWLLMASLAFGMVRASSRSLRDTVARLSAGAVEILRALRMPDYGPGVCPAEQSIMHARAIQHPHRRLSG
jgi:hypothetical protein